MMAFLPFIFSVVRDFNEFLGKVSSVFEEYIKGHDFLISDEHNRTQFQWLCLLLDSTFAFTILHLQGMCQISALAV